MFNISTIKCTFDLIPYDQIFIGVILNIIGSDFKSIDLISFSARNHGYAPDVDDQEEPEDPLCNSIGLDQENLDPYRYGITPPTNTRAMKRAKEKARSHKFSSKTEMREMMHQIKREASPRASAGQTAPVRPDRICLGNMANPDSDSDDSKQSASVRKRKPSGSKNYKVSRRQDRDYKHQSGAGNVSTSIPKNTVVQVDSPNHFKSLDTKIQVGISGLPASVNTIPGCVLLSNTAPCSKDRMDFIRTFNMLIRMGNKATKDRESRATQLNRQLSTELQAKYSDIIWLELRAYLNKRKVEDQDDLQYKLQLQVPRVLREIMNFRVNLQKQPLPQRPNVGLDKKSAVIAEVEEDNQVTEVLFPIDMDASDSDRRPSCDKRSERFRNSSVLSFCQGICDTNNDQEVALLQVAALLDKLERVETLYPTYKAFGLAHTLYNDPAFLHRIRTLYLWINITIEMGNKLHHIAKMLRIDSMGVEWPWLNYNPRQFLEAQSQATSNQPIYSQPSDYTESDTSDEEYDSDEYETDESEDEENDEDPQTPNKLKLPHLKNVRFEMSDSNSSAPQSPECETPAGGDRSLFLSPTDSSTPNKLGPPSRNSSVLSVSRSSSNISFEDSAHTIYQNYADRMLKKTGVTKLTTRLKDLLEGTLQRAKGALETARAPPSYATVASLEVCISYYM